LPNDAGLNAVMDDVGIKPVSLPDPPQAAQADEQDVEVGRGRCDKVRQNT
jgi:hypothetical protein